MKTSAKTLQEWLKDCPNPSWRFQIAYRYKYNGIRQFGKVAAKVEGLDPLFLSADKVEVIGAVRPLICPDVAPDGSEFYLASFDGVSWGYHLPRLRDNQDEIRNQRLQRFNDAEKEPLNEPDSAGLIFKQMRNALALGDLDDALSWAFEAGLAVGTRRATHKFEGVVALHFQRLQSNEWVEVIKGALVRYGVDLTPKQVAERMGGELRIRKRFVLPCGSNSPEVFYWKFPLGQEIDQKHFQQAHKRAKEALRNDS